MSEKFAPGDVVIGRLSHGNERLTGVVIDEPDGSQWRYPDRFLVWAYWCDIRWTPFPTFLDEHKVEMHPDPDPVLASYAAWILTR